MSYCKPNLRSRITRFNFTTPSDIINDAAIWNVTLVCAKNKNQPRTQEKTAAKRKQENYAERKPKNSERKRNKCAMHDKTTKEREKEKYKKKKLWANATLTCFSQATLVAQRTKAMRAEETRHPLGDRISIS